MKKVDVAVKCLIEYQSKYLVLWKPGNKIDLPGGRIEYSETIEEALTREVNEETSLGVNNFDLLNASSFVRPDGLQLYILAYGSSYGPDKPIVNISDEHLDYSILSKAEIALVPNSNWIIELIDKYEIMNK